MYSKSQGLPNGMFFECIICSKGFSHKIGLNIHLRTHFTKKSCVCYICQEVFLERCDLLEHLQTHKEKKLLTCDKCHKVFPNKVALNVHLQTHTKKEHEDVFISDKDILDNVETEHKKSSLSYLLQCNKDSSDYSVSQKEKAFKCNVSQKKSSSLNLSKKRKKSIRSNASQNKNKLSECNAFENDECCTSESSKKPLIRNLSKSKDIVDESPLSVKNNFNNSDVKLRKHYLCSVCGNEFFTQNGLNSHVCKPENKEIFTCDVCQAVFPLKTLLYSHIHRHKRFRCSFCQKEFSDSQKYLYHTNTHKKPFKCSICEKGFATQLHLDDHINMHTNERPYECEICLTTFSQKSHFNRHIRIHEKGNFTFRLRNRKK